MKKVNNNIHLKRGWTAFVWSIVVLLVVLLLLCFLEMPDKVRNFIYLQIGIAFVCSAYFMFPRGELRFDESGFKIITRNHRVKKFYSWGEIVFIQYYCHRRNGTLIIRKERERISLAIDYFLPDGYIINGRNGYCERLDRELEAICRSHHVQYTLNCPTLNEKQKSKKNTNNNEK